MRFLVTILLLIFTKLVFAVPADLLCFSEKKLIFKKHVERVFQEGDLLIAQDKDFTYVIVGSDCIIRYKTTDLPKKSAKK